MEEFKDLCTAIKEIIPAGYKWEWDSRFAAALVCLNEPDSMQVQKNITGIFQKNFDAASIKKAADSEQKLAQALSGLKKGQILFTTSQEENTLFGAWWPWGDASHVSLRLGFYFLKADPESEKQAAELLSYWFDLK